MDMPSEKPVLVEQAYGMWADRIDIDDTWLAEGRKRWWSAWYRNEWSEQDELISDDTTDNILANKD